MKNEQSMEVMCVPSSVGRVVARCSCNIQLGCFFFIFHERSDTQKRQNKYALVLDTRTIGTTARETKYRFVFSAIALCRYCDSITMISIGRTFGNITGNSDIVCVLFHGFIHWHILWLFIIIV